MKQIDDLNAKFSVLEDKIEKLETTVKVLESTSVPKWFIDEFGETALNGIVDTPIGDVDFWRNTAVSIRLINKK